MIGVNPEISVIICSYNRARYIREALESLYQQDISKDLYEVIIVDNNSTDETDEVCRAFLKNHPDLYARYLKEAQQGSSFARNTGAKAAKGNILVFMDDDALAESNFISGYINLFKQIPDAVGAGGRIIPKYIPEEPVWMSYYVSSLVGNFDYSPVRCQFKKGKYPLESNMAVRREAFNRIGGFNTDLPGVKGTLRIGGEGKDFFYRLTADGSNIIYDPTIRVRHVVETAKLTREYMYRVASGIGRGERVRIREAGKIGYLFKLSEYLFKLAASFVLAFLYLLKGKPKQSIQVIHFRMDVIDGFIGINSRKIGISQ
jgi:glycosyltransferase involved in cell wall biosynthesis